MQIFQAVLSNSSALNTDPVVKNLTEKDMSLKNVKAMDDFDWNVIYRKIGFHLVENLEAYHAVF